MMLLLSGNILLNFVPIINPEGKPWVVSICHMSKHNMTNVQLNELMSKEALLFMAECIPLKALGFSYWLLQHREDKQITCGFKSKMRLFHLYPPGPMVDKLSSTSVYLLPRLIHCFFAPQGPPVGLTRFFTIHFYDDFKFFKQILYFCSMVEEHSGITSGHENRPGKSLSSNLGKSRAENTAYGFLNGRDWCCRWIC